MQPTSWPKYVIENGLPSGKAAYYWNPPNRNLKAGFALRREALGTDGGAAIARANELNRHLDDWRKGRGSDKELDLQPGFGTMAWLVERYKRSRAWEKVSRRSRYEHDRAFKLVAHAGGILIGNSRTPVFDTCRALLALGITGKLQVGRPGKDRADMQLDIKRGAGLAIRETATESLRLMPSHPWWPSDDVSPKAVRCRGVQPHAVTDENCRPSPHGAPPARHALEEPVCAPSGNTSSCRA